jgi:hypothetical protein
MRSPRTSGSEPRPERSSRSRLISAGRLAQLGERLPYKQEVGGSIPSPPIACCENHNVRLAIVVLTALSGALLASGCGSSSTAGMHTCSVTRPQSSSLSGARPVNYRHGNLGVVLWPRGHLVAGQLPGGGAYAVVNDDGSIYAKQGWWRWVDGRLRVSGKRIDQSVRPLAVDVPYGYESDGFQPVGLTFPTTGCWQIVGRVGNASLTYVVSVTKAQRETR